MKTENLSTLKINKLSQKQYDRESVAGNLNENEIYLTPDTSLTVWQPNTEYQVGDVVIATWENEDKEETVIAKCNEVHTSSASFTNDLVVSAVWDMKSINAYGDEYGRNIYNTYATKEELEEALENIPTGEGGTITVDQTYSPDSENAQSGKAVAQAIDTFFTDKNMKLIKEITLIEDVGAIDILTKDEGIELRDTFIYCSFLVTEAGSKNIALIKDRGHCYYGYGLNVGNYTEEQVTNGKPNVFGHFIYPIGETGRVLTLGLEGTVSGNVNPVTGWSQGLMMHNSKFTYTYHPDPNIFAEKIDNLNMFLIGRTETNLIKAGSKIWLFGRRVK